jgi:multidrug efflux pump subunit AcrB
VNRRISSFSIIIVFILLILCGIPLVWGLNLELDPNAGTSALNVTFKWSNTEPRIIEQEATSRLEALFSQVQGIKRITSQSGNGLGVITVTLDKKANTDAVRFEISSLIRQSWAEMPPGTGYPKLTVNRSDDKEERPLLTYTLNSPARPDIVMRYAEEKLKPLLARVNGIYKIDVSGATPMQWVINYDVNIMQATGVTTNDIENAVNHTLNKVFFGTGTVAAGDKKGKSDVIPVMLQQESTDPDDLLLIPLKRSANRILRLKDVARISYEEQEPQSYYRINGLNTINIMIYAETHENNLVLGKEVKSALAAFAPSLPRGYKLLLMDDSTEYITHELYNICLRTLFTFIILLVFILLVTRNIKHVLLIFIMLFGNLCIAVIFYYLFTLEIHLYALAGITVSLGLMTDNIIIMSDHLRTHGNRKVFLSILAGTLATVSALTIVFFLGEELKANLVDFALVVIINQIVSLFTALFVIPALMDVMKIDKKGISYKKKVVQLYPKQVSFKRKAKWHKRGIVIWFSSIYQDIIIFVSHHRAIMVLVFIIGFGLPVYLLPDSLDGIGWPQKIYNSTLGKGWYIENVRPVINKIFGGTLRLFTEKVFEGSYFGNSQETSLYITATMPHGTTLEQANSVISRMEAYLNSFGGIKMFRSDVSALNSSIVIYFNKNEQHGSFPYTLKNNVISRSIELGGAYWGVYGFGDGFNNSVTEGTGNYSVRLTGYNFDQLTSLANELKRDLEKNPRNKEVYIQSQPTWIKPDNTGFVAVVDKERAVVAGTGPSEMLASMSDWALDNNPIAAIKTDTGSESIVLRSKESEQTDLWSLSRRTVRQDSLQYKFTDLSVLKKELTSSLICKENQQYLLFLQFDYVGSNKSARKHINKTVENFKTRLPIGYSIFEQSDYLFWSWTKDKTQYWLLGLIIVMIFFVCAVLFESLFQPFAVILTIPVAYIGLFLTFYLFRINFDQGGFAAMIILTGITVNAAIYILNDYNNLRRSHSGRNLTCSRLYVRAFNYKITPVLLTVTATVLGFIPFLVGEKQAFWYALAAGTIGGLLFSLIGIFIFLPLFLGISNKTISK